MKYYWWWWQSELSDEEVNNIIKVCESEKYQETDACIGHGAGEHVDSIYRTSKIRFINEPDLSDKIWNYVHEANNNAFGFDIVKTNSDIQYTKYNSEDAGHYNWHRDNNWLKQTYFDRKLSIVIQLSDPSEYEGGALQFRIDGETLEEENFKPKGSIIVFPSFIKHRVTEVTKGTRRSLVSWIEGPKFR